MKAKKFGALILGSILLVSQTQVYAAPQANNKVLEKISFEPGQNYSFVKGQGDVIISPTDFWAVDGKKGLSVQYTKYNAQKESGSVVIDKNGTWNMTKDGAIYFDYYNTSDVSIQVRVDVKDVNGNTRTNYYTVKPWTKTNIEVKDLGPKKSNASGEKGWWGAENGLDCSKIDSIRIYQWGDSKANRCVIDNINILGAKSTGGGGTTTPPTTPPSTGGGGSTSSTYLSFEDGKIPSYAEFAQATGQVVTQGSTAGSKALKVNFQSGGFPSVRFVLPQKANWGKNAAFAFDITNPGSRAETYYVKIIDGRGQEAVGSVIVPAGKTQSAFMTFDKNANSLAMRYFPPTGGRERVSYSWGTKNLDTTDIREITFFMYTPPHSASMIVDNIKTINDPAKASGYLNGIVDPYGQYSGKDWKDKVHNDNELKATVNKEKSWMNNNKQDMSKRSKYGGWSAGPKLKATGYFRTEKYDGKWTLVDPEGYIYFATGLDILRFDDMNTWISGRENMFKNVPKNSHYKPVGQVHTSPHGLTSGFTYNFYTANLEKKYGSSYATAWANQTYDRMKNWGFTTLGNWSDPDLFWKTAEQKQMPFIADCWIRGNFGTIDDGNVPGQITPDAFDPAFRTATINSLKSINGGSVKNNPWCVGMYINNEISWGSPLGDPYSVVAAAMNKPANSSHAKRAFIAEMKKKYGNIGALNRSWGTNFGNFDALNNANILPANRTSGLTSDLSKMLTMLATQYYKTVNECFDSIYPNTLNFGSRLAEWGCPKEVEQACAKYVDVVSYNCYKESVKTEGNWMRINSYDKPAIIGEFHFGAKGERMYSPGLIAASNQAERGKMYTKYITDLLQTDCFVGGQWFQYIDQPITGRAWDGENYNAGFVDVADVPYYELVNAAKDIHDRQYKVKYPNVKENAGGSNNNNNNNNNNNSGNTSTQMTVFNFEGNTGTGNVKSKDGASFALNNYNNKKSLEVNVKNLNSVDSGITLNPNGIHNLGRSPKVTAKLTNPNNKAIQVRLELVTQGAAPADGYRTYYFTLNPGQTRDVTMSNLGAKAANFNGADGWWGAASGVSVAKLDAINVTMWEQQPGNTATKFRINNIKLSK